MSHLVFVAVTVAAVQILARRPHMAAHGSQTAAWNELVDALNKNTRFASKLTLKTAREKFQSMMKHYRADERAKISSTGTDDEVVDELYKLLEDLKQLEDDDKDTKSGDKASKSQEEKVLIVEGEKLRVKAVGQVKSEKSKTTSTASSSAPISIAETVGKFLDAKIELEKRKLELEERRFLAQVDTTKRARSENYSAE
jgi:hypothetical protein